MGQNEANGNEHKRVRIQKHPLNVHTISSKKK